MIEPDDGWAGAARRAGSAGRGKPFDEQEIEPEFTEGMLAPDQIIEYPEDAPDYVQPEPSAPGFAELRREIAEGLR